MTLRIAAALLVAASLALPARADRPVIAVTIKPLHSLASMVAGDAAEVRMLLGDAASPHGTSLSPDAVRTLNDAAVVVWASNDLELFMPDVVASLTHHPLRIEAAALPGMVTLKNRHGGRQPAADGHHDHGQPGSVDPHVWLDSANAGTIVRVLAAALAGRDGANASVYRDNMRRAVDRIDALDRRLAARLDGLGDRPFVVFHDGFQYFEHRYGLAAAAVVTLHPEQAPGAKRIAEIRAVLRDTGAACIFTEPQFSPRIVNTIVEGMPTRTASLDPLGVGVAAGAGAWERIMEDLAGALEGCLR